MELQLLRGARHLLAAQKKLKIAVCTYHRPGDAEQFKRILDAYSFQTVFSRGYLLLLFAKQEPLVRRGLIRGEKFQR
jgi:RNA-binding protein YhbY